MIFYKKERSNMDNYKIIDKIIDRTVTIGGKSGDVKKQNNYFDFEAWEWPQGVGMYGIYRAYKNSGEEKYKDVLISWYERRFSEILPDKNINTTAPMYTLAYMYEDNLTEREKIEPILHEWADWVMNVAPRTCCGGLEHSMRDKNGNIQGLDTTEQMWADTVFMTVMFLAKYAEIFDRDDCRREAKNQLLLHIKYLQDKETGLFYHGYHAREEHNFGKIFWGRGNCWLTIALSDYLELIGQSDEDYEYLKGVLCAQADSLMKYQTKNGMWRTVIMNEASYEETSATAGFTYGVVKGIKSGLLDKRYQAMADSAINALFDNVDENGTVHNVSAGTVVGWDDEAYIKIPIQERIYGQSMVLLALAV